ncbi:MAG: dTDP-4-dehydrorhamnose 3,5-epimerase [Holophagae bacterium]
MNVADTAIADVKLIVPEVFEDQRGFFMESYNRRRLAEAGITADFVQDNHSRSRRGVLRGLHYQLHQGQAKLVRATVGRVFDAVVDIRRGSPTFGQWVGYELSESNRRQLYAPAGFAHGFLVLSEVAEFQYKCSDFYDPDDERGLPWDDPGINIRWPLDGLEPVLSDRDRGWRPLSAAPDAELPEYGV